MRATATPAPIRKGKRRLLESCAITAGMMALACGGPALAQVAGSGTITTLPSGTTANTGANPSTVNVNGPQSIVDWTPSNTPVGGVIDFLPAGNTLNFVGDAPGYIVLNRFVSASGLSITDQIALNGTVNSTIGATTGPRGGNIWFSNAGGILIGSAGVINVGSLVLTASSIDTSGGLLGPGNTIRFRGPASTSAVTVNGAINANNDGNPGSSYVALVAPRVVQAGNVRVDGSAGYVAAEQADIRINGGLFDINVLVGADGGNVITHTGATTGPAHQDGDTDQSRIYMVAIPKNDAVTMLVSGAIGYDDALSAQIDPDGAVRLSAGYNVTAGELNATPANAAAANITAGDVLFRSDTSARASGAFVGQSAQSLPTSPPPLSSAGQFFVEGSGIFIGDASATLTIGADQSGGALGGLTVQSGGANAALGNAGINVTGGTLSAGDLTIRASGEAQALTGDSQGGTASLTITDGSVTASAVTVEANGIAAIGTNGTAGDGRGGTAGIAVSGTGSALTSDRITINSRGAGHFTILNPSDPFSAVDSGGAGQGGTSTLTVSNGGSVVAAIDLSVDAGGFGATGSIQSGSGAGGTARIQFSGAGSLLSTGGISLRADGNGGGNISNAFGSFLTQNGGNATGGTAEMILSADATATASLGFVGVTADARGGEAGGSENARGGDALGGIATLIADGGISAQFDGLTLSSWAFGGAATSPSGNSARTGNAQGNSVILRAANGSTIDAGAIGLFASGIVRGEENLGTATGGDIAVAATSGGTITTPSEFRAEAVGGTIFTADGQSAGDAVGGNIDLTADGGTISAEYYAIDASADTIPMAGLGVGGEARGGTIDLLAANAGQIATSGDSENSLDASAVTGVSNVGTSATGGTIQLIASGGGSIDLDPGVTLSANAMSGGAQTSGPNDPVGTGGSILVRAGSSATDTSTISLGEVTASADGRSGFDFSTGFPLDTAGSGQGGTAAFEIQGGTLTALSMEISANGFGGGTDSRTGTGGIATFTQTGGNADVGDMMLHADGFGGSGEGQSGLGIGGIATIGLLGGTITGADIVATANGIGGLGSSGTDADPASIIPGGLGGLGRGGAATITIEGSAVVDASTIHASATGSGGAGGDFFNASSFGGAPGTPGNGGEGTGGDATVNIRGGTTTTNGMIADASGIGGDGGNSFFSSSSGGATGIGVGGTGGAGRGGTATIALAASVAADSLFNSVAQGIGGNGGSHNVGGDGGGGFGGVAQAIVTGFDVGDLSVILDASAQGGAGGDANDGNGGNGGNAFGGIARAQADGAGGRVGIVDGNFITDGVGGNGGSGRLGFGSAAPAAPSGGNGGTGTGGTIEALASNAGAIDVIATNSGGIAFLDSQGRGGNGGGGSSISFGTTGGSGGTGGSGAGGSVNLIASGGTVALSGNSLAVAVNGMSGDGGMGGDSPGGAGPAGATSTTTGGNVLFEATNGPTSAGQIQLGLTGIGASGDMAGRVVFRGDGSIAMTALNVLVTGAAAPTNNNVDTAASGIFLAPLAGGSITTSGDMELTTDGSVGIYAQSSGAVSAGGALTIQAGDQVDIRHAFREGAASTVQAADDLGITAGTSISGAPGSLLGAGGTLSLTAGGPTATIGVDRLDATDIVISSVGAASVEHAEAANDFTATGGSFRTGLNSIITGGDINITSPGTIDLGNSSAGGFVFVEGQSIAFNNVDAGNFVALRAIGFGPADGVTGANITAGNAVSISGGGVGISGTIQAGASLSITATRRDAAVGLADAAGNVSTFAAGNLTGVYRAGGNVNLNADGNINAEADAAGGYTDPSGGFVSEGYVFADADGDAALSNSSAATMMGIRSGGAAALTGGTAGEDIFVLGGTTANLSGVTAGDDIAVEASGGITIADAQTTGTGPDARSVAYAGGASSPTPFLQIQTTAADLSNVTLLAPTASITAANISAFDNLSATGGTIAASGPLSAGGNIVATATGVIDLADSTAGGFVQMSGQSIAFDAITAGLNVDLSSDGTTAGAEGINGGSITAGGDINLFANSIGLTGTVMGDASFFAFSTGGAVSVSEADVAGTISIFSAVDLTGSYVAGGDIFLNSDANITASAQANGGFVDGNGIAAQGNLFVIAAGDATLTDSLAARMFGVNAGLAASVTGGTAGEDVLILAGTTAGLTDVTAGDDVTVRALGNITALNVRTTGTGTDTRILDFSAASGSPMFTIGSGEGTQGTNGADIVMASTAGAIDAAALSAGDDILLNAANSIAVNGATTLGLGVTGGDSSVQTQGGATTLANVDSFSDVIVDAAGTANLTGPVAAGRNAAINAQDVTLAALTDTGGAAIPTLSANGVVVVNSAAGITGGGVRALGNATLTAGTAIGITSIEGQDVTLTGATGVTANEAYVLGTTNLDSSDGDIRISALLASGLINASANAIRIEGGGNMHFSTLTTDVGDAYVRGGGDFSVANGNVTGTADLGTQGELMNIGNLTAANAIIDNAGGALNLDTVTVAGSVNASARSSLSVNGVVTGQSISLASAAITIAPTGRVGTAGVTQALSVANNNSDNQTFIGGTAGPNGPNGYHIDADELTRLYGTQIAIFAPEVQAAGGGSVGSAAPPDVIVDSFTMAGGAAGSNLGANGALTIETPGKMRVIGNVQLTGLTDDNALNLLAGDALEVILGQGTVRLVNGTNPAGRLNMVSDDIIVATAAAITAVGSATTVDAINARLGENDGVLLDEGALFARGIRADVVGGFYVQNSGAGTDFGQRRGLTFGAGGLDVTTEGPSRIVLNGVQIGPNGQITGLDAIPLLTIAGTAPASGGFDPRSTFNGCFIANPAACTTVTVDFESNFPVQDVIEEETDADGDDGDGNSLPTPLITMRDLDPLSGEPLVDDPVTGAGNDDLWTTPDDAGQP